MRVLYTGVPDKEIQEARTPSIFFDYGFAAPIQAIGNGLSEWGYLSVPEKGG
jgi:hypothetical protein